MKFVCSFRLIAVLLLAISCKTASKQQVYSSEAQFDDRYVRTDNLEAEIGNAHCAEGEEEMRLALGTLDPLPKIEDLGIEGYTKVETAYPQFGRSLRLDVCLNGESGEALLKRAVHGAGMGAYIVMVNKSGTLVEGLTEAVYGDPANLKIELPYTKFPLKDSVDYRLRVKGVKVGDKVVIVENHEEKVDGKYQPLPPTNLIAGRLWAGTLEYSDPFAADGCGGAVAQGNFLEFEDVRIELKFCVGVGTSGTWAGELTELHVIDNTPGLAPDVKGQKIAIKLENIKGKGNHHNVCDSLWVHTEWADYKFTAGPQSGVGDAGQCLDQENTFVVNPKPTDGSPWYMVYEVTYQDKNIQKKFGRFNFNHYGKKNPNKL
jgi:hypothetical protein